MNDDRQILPVIPAKAGIQHFWVPAFAGTTDYYSTANS